MLLQFLVWRLLLSQWTFNVMMKYTMSLPLWKKNYRKQSQLICIFESFNLNYEYIKLIWFLPIMIWNLQFGKAENDTYSYTNIKIHKYLNHIVDFDDGIEIVCRTWFHVSLAPIGHKIYIDCDQTNDEHRWRRQWIIGNSEICSHIICYEKNGAR